VLEVGGQLIGTAVVWLTLGLIELGASTRHAD
jgi:hypothetical protein